MPLLFLLWVNLHASFFAGLFILGLVLGCELIKKSNLKSSLVLLGVALVSFLATFINPYGFRIYEEIFRTVGDNYLKFHIAEWMPLFFSGFKPLISLYLGLMIAFLVICYRKITLNQLVLSVVFLLLSLLSIRYFLVLVIVSLPMLIDSATHVKERINVDAVISSFKKASYFYKLALLMPAILILSSFIMYFYQLGVERINSNKKDFYPSQALPFLKMLPLSENMFNDYAWGGYLIWQIPERKLFIDGRMPSWRQNGQFVFKEYIEVTEAKKGFENILKKYDVKLALIPKGNLSEALIRLGWKNIYEDETVLVLKKY